MTVAFDAEEVSNSRIINEAGAMIHVVMKIGDAHVLLFVAGIEYIQKSLNEAMLTQKQFLKNRTK